MEESGINSSVPEEDSTCDPTQSLLQRQNAQGRRNVCPRMARLRSKGAVLVIVWVCLITASLASNIAETAVLTGHGSLIALAGILVGPFAGLVASICCSRYKVLQCSLLLMWTANVTICFIVIFKDLVPATPEVVNNVGLGIGEAVYLAAFGVIWVNLVPFGLDQMPDASSEQIKAFISRFVWALFSGAAAVSVVSTIYKCIHLHGLDAAIVQSFLSAVLLLLVVCSSYLQKGWLIIEPAGGNPLKTLYSVIKFAVKHKHPIRRSAFTYCEDERPSRIDLSKSKYGGPFTTEEVEDAKTCLQMTLVIACVSFVLFPGVSLVVSLPHVLHAEFLLNTLSTCHRHLSQSTYLPMVLVVLSPPVHELIIYPLIKKWIPGTLKGIGITQILTLFGGLTLLTTSIWYAKHNSAKCIFASTGDYSPLSVNGYWIEVPITFLVGCFEFFAYVGLLEFTCAQAPYRQRGLLLGLLYSIILVSTVVGAIVFRAWSIGYQKKGANSPECGVWFYLFLTISTLFGGVVWCCVAKWYKKRERNEPDRSRIFIEDYYDRYCGPQTP